MGGRGGRGVVIVRFFNNPPAITPFTISTLINGTYPFTAAEFSSRYSDTEGTAFSGITVASLPSTGTLRLNGATVTANTFISASDLNRLTYSSPSTTGSTSFNITVSDGASTSGNTLVTINNLAAQVAFGTVGNTNWTVPANVTRVDLLLVGGGGGGGGSLGGGGGAGGLIYSNNLAVTPGASIPVTVGAGGAGGPNDSIGSNGSNSVFGTLTALGGGAGGGRIESGGSAGGGRPGVAGGSGGGGSQRNNGTAGSHIGGCGDAAHEFFGWIRQPGR